MGQRPPHPLNTALHIRTKFRKVTETRNLACKNDVGMMLECNLELFSRAVLLAKAHKSMCASIHDMRIRHENSTGYPSRATV